MVSTQQARPAVRSNFVLERFGATERGAAGRIEIPIDELELCHLRNAAQVAQVAHLRDEIHLPEAVRRDPGFASREKKEMRPDSLVLSNYARNSSEPFGLSRWTGVLPPASRCSTDSRSSPPGISRPRGKSAGWSSRPGSAAGPKR